MKIDKMSPQFNELIKGMLEKDVRKRFTWQEIINHSFWGEKIEMPRLPNQPHFDNWLKKSEIHNPVNNKKNIDVLRLSLNALKNMQKEETNNYKEDVK